MESKELKKLFSCNREKWVFLHEVINGKTVEIKAFISKEVFLQVFKIDGKFVSCLNYQSITKTVKAIFDVINK